MYGRHVTRVQYFTACTLDGFIADENHSLDWLFDAPHSDDDGGWDEFIGGVGPMVMGSSTYEWVVRRYDLLANPEPWHDFYADRPCWVFSPPRSAEDPDSHHSHRHRRCASRVR